MTTKTESFTDRTYVLHKDIRPDPNQPRKEFAEAQLIELSVNMASVGILEELLVRQDPEKKVAYMIVDGERRWRAAKLAKIERLPIRVREMTDAEARRYQRVSGTQRANLTALDQADDFARELGARRAKDPKFSLETLAAELGLTRSSAYNCRTLALASKPVRQAMVNGEIDASKALVVCSVAPNLQAKVLQEATEDDGLSVRRLRDLISEEYQRSLKGAPFDTKDAKLCSKVGACETCPKRTGNLFSGQSGAGSPDICTDVECFNDKTKASVKNKIEEAKAKGQRVMPPETYERVQYSDDYHKANDTNYYDNKRRTYGQLAKIADISPIVTIDDEDRLIEVFDPGDVAKMEKAAGVKRSTGASNNSGRSAAARKRQILQTKIEDEVIGAMVAATEGKSFTLEVWRLMTSATVKTCWSDTVRDVIRRRKLGFKGYTQGDQLAKTVAKMTEAQCRGLLFEILVARGMRGWYGVSANASQAVKLFKINKASIAKRVKAEMKKGKKPKASKPAKKGKAKK